MDVFHTRSDKRKIITWEEAVIVNLGLTLTLNRNNVKTLPQLEKTVHWQYVPSHYALCHRSEASSDVDDSCTGGVHR